MANSKGPASVGNLMYNTRNSLLPPKIPFPSIAPAYVDYVPSSAIGQKGDQKSREGNSHHQRTSSESQLIEEQPSWLDELLDEPETPVRRGGHRRSSSDSFAYIDVANAINLDYVAQTENKFRHIAPFPSWAPQDFDHPRDALHVSFVPEQNSFGKQKNRARDANLNNAHSRGVPSPSNMVKNAGSLRAQQELEVVPTIASEKEHILESGHHDSKGSSEKKDSCHSKPAASETDTKRAKQQFAQRSRVRKLQYIAELERNAQALQVEGSEVSAELEFLNQQSLILSMENKALKQRLESLAQEQIIKYLEHEVLEREIVRLRALYQKQQQPPPQSQPTSGHRRKSSKDLDQQLASLSLKQKDASSARENISGQLHI